VFSPLDKSRFNLRSGECLDDPTRPVRTWAVEVVDGVVLVAPTTAVPQPSAITAVA
jgi:nitrite reductase (NADH) small subunit